MLGVQVDALTIPQLNSLIAEAVQNQQKWIIANHNLHSLYLYHHDTKMKDFYRKADYVHIDGMALVIMGKFLGLALERKHRVTYADWVWPLIQEAANQGWRVFYLGSKPGVATQGVKILQNKFPGLEMKANHGYFDSSPNSPANQTILAEINAYKPNVLMVGMSMPRQEYWILDNLDNIQTNAILTSGACIDYVAGVIPTPPRWMGKVGLEWLYRLFSEPKRLWKRYLVEPWFLVKLLLKAKFDQYFKKP
jgi:N-acetylglucosaminyldiphosphoundecaprenol N-acetyl-beta-D-mannosaminyltransferase